MIGPEDPPPFTIVNPLGKARVLLVGDHVSNAIPGILDNLGLDETVLHEPLQNYVEIGLRVARGAADEG